MCTNCKKIISGLFLCVIVQAKRQFSGPLTYREGTIIDSLMNLQVFILSLLCREKAVLQRSIFIMFALYYELLQYIIEKKALLLHNNQNLIQNNNESNLLIDKIKLLPNERIYTCKTYSTNWDGDSYRHFVQQSFYVFLKLKVKWRTVSIV